MFCMCRFCYDWERGAWCVLNDLDHHSGGVVVTYGGEFVPVLVSGDSLVGSAVGVCRRCGPKAFGD